MLDLSSLLEKGKIENELELEEALIIERKLRITIRENPKLKPLRKKLRSIISDYESKFWKSHVSLQRLKESDLAESIAEKERKFVRKRRELIRKKLKSLGLNQQKLGVILGHSGKSYMSELMNGIHPFSLKDLIVIHHLLKIELTDLIPTFLSPETQKSVQQSIQQFPNVNLKFTPDNFATI